MPIYEYRCGSCGFEKEYLQKLSDAPITDCPACGKAAMVKLLSAAGFQLKGTGWYATDFKHGSQRKPGEAASKSEAGDKPDAAKSDKGDGSSKSPDGSNKASGGSSKAPDGSNQASDGSSKGPDGSSKAPDRSSKAESAPAQGAGASPACQ